MSVALLHVLPATTSYVLSQKRGACELACDTALSDSVPACTRTNMLHALPVAIAACDISHCRQHGMLRLFACLHAH